MVTLQQPNSLVREGSLGQIPILSCSMSASGGAQLAGGIRTRMKATKGEVAEAFISNLRDRGNINVDQPGFIESIRQHFEALPSRYAIITRCSRFSHFPHIAPFYPIQHFQPADMLWM